MIHIREHILDTHSTIETPVAKSVIKGVCSILNVKGKIALTKNGKDYANKYWDAGNTDNTKDGVRPLVITCSYSDEYEPSTLVNSNVNKPKSRPVFRDESNNISVDTLHIGKRNTLTMEFRTKSDNMASNIEDALRLMRIENTDVFDLRILYKYFMGSNAFNIVKYAGGSDIEDYMASNTDTRFTLISTIDGSRAQYGFKVNSLVQATITSDSANDKVEFDRDSSTYMYTLTLKYMYEKPTYMDIKYDYVINDSVIPDSLIPDDVGIRAVKDLKDNGFESINPIIDYIYGVKDGGYYIRIPEWDRHVDLPNYTPYTTIFSVLLEPNTDGSLILFNLNSLGDLKLDPAVLKLLQDEKNYLIGEHSIFNITLHCGGKTITSEHLVIDSALNIISNAEIECKGPIRVLVGIVNDSSYLPKVDLTRLQNKDVFNDLKDLGYLDRSSDVRELEFELNLPGMLKSEYIVMYSDVVSKYIGKV